MFAACSCVPQLSSWSQPAQSHRQAIFSWPNFSCNRWKSLTGIQFIIIFLPALRACGVPRLKSHWFSGPYCQGHYTHKDTNVKPYHTIHITISLLSYCSIWYEWMDVKYIYIYFSYVIVVSYIGYGGSILSDVLRCCDELPRNTRLSDLHGGWGVTLGY